MVCGTCGATIADKAIVCYRCGTATAIPGAGRSPERQPLGLQWLIVSLLLDFVAIGAVWFAFEQPGWTSTRVGLIAAAVVAAVASIVVLAMRSRR